MNLTAPQHKAIAHDGRNLQLIACAGSGKTEVVARRVVHLLTPGSAGSLLPRNIVAFTFTDKAAAELKERVVTRTRQALGDIAGMAEMFVGTIHAFCLALLKSESPRHLRFEVLNEVQQGLFVDRNSSKSGLTTSTDLAGAPLKRYRDTLEGRGTLRPQAPQHRAQGCRLGPRTGPAPKEFSLRLESEPFSVRGYRRIAVKVVDAYGNESVLVRELP
jgi:DNA helicase-2/ATP-dependent DNA helicase PcrA